MKMDIIIVGTGGLAKEIWGMLTNMGHSVGGFVAKEASEELFCGLPILGDDNWLMEQKSTYVVVANGKPAVRRSIFEKLRQAPLIFPAIIHPEAILLGKPRIRGGCIVMPGGVIMPGVTLGYGCHVNMGVTIGHDVDIGDYCVLNHNAGISGNIHIGSEVLVGAGATIIEQHYIGDRVTIGAGAVVTKNIPPGETWIGVPAKQLVKQATLAEVYGITQ